VGIKNGKLDPNTAAAIRSWRGTFGGRSPWLVQVAPGSGTVLGTDVYETNSVHRLANELAAAGVQAEYEVVHAGDAAQALADFAQTQEGPVIMVSSERWTDAGTAHLFSTGRALTRHATYPVLVVRRTPTASARAAS
jgi:nucleotide-binding universal stress UspA family protein